MLDSDGNKHPYADAAAAETHDDAGPEIDRGDLRQMLLDSLAPGTVAWDHAVTGVVSEAGGRWRLEFQGPPGGDGPTSWSGPTGWGRRCGRA